MNNQQQHENKIIVFSSPDGRQQLIDFDHLASVRFGEGWKTVRKVAAYGALVLLIVGFAVMGGLIIGKGHGLASALEGSSGIIVSASMLICTFIYRKK
jgi:hypothetical protein